MTTRYFDENGREITRAEYIVAQARGTVAARVKARADVEQRAIESEKAVADAEREQKAAIEREEKAVSDAQAEAARIFAEADAAEKAAAGRADEPAPAKAEPLEDVTEQDQ